MYAHVTATWHVKKLPTDKKEFHISCGHGDDQWEGFFPTDKGARLTIREHAKHGHVVTLFAPINSETRAAILEADKETAANNTSVYEAAQGVWNYFESGKPDGFPTREAARAAEVAQDGWDELEGDDSEFWISPNQVERDAVAFEVV